MAKLSRCSSEKPLLRTHVPSVFVVKSARSSTATATKGRWRSTTSFSRRNRAQSSNVKHSSLYRTSTARLMNVAVVSSSRGSSDIPESEMVMSPHTDSGSRDAAGIAYGKARLRPSSVVAAASSTSTLELRRRPAGCRPATLRRRDRAAPAKGSASAAAPPDGSLADALRLRCGGSGAAAAPCASATASSSHSIDSTTRYTLRAQR